MKNLTLNGILPALLTVLSYTQMSEADSLKGPFICQGSTEQTFSFELSQKPHQYSFFGEEKIAGQLNYVNELGLEVSEPILVTTSSLNTRAYNGVNYSFKLPSGLNVKLTNIINAIEDYQDLTDKIKGQASNTAIECHTN